MGEEKEIFFRYGVYWKKKGEYYEALCPECEKALNIFGGKKQVSLTNLFCPECKKVRPLYIGDGIPITIHKAVELLMTEKPEVKPECEEETSDIGVKLIALSKAVDTQDIVCNKVRECRDYLSYEINKAMTEIDRNIVSSVIELKELYLPIASSTQNKVAGAALLTCAFLLGGIITFAIMSFLG